MSDKKTHRRKRAREKHPSAAGSQQALPAFQVKEYNYVLGISPQDGKLLDTYREQLAAATAGFAEVYYNFLFDNPDVAGVLYGFVS